MTTSIKATKMSLILLNLQSNQQIKLDVKNPLIIGRKNVEGCFDKRVSRNHGRVTCTTDGKIQLEALHCNPCFFTRNGVPPVLQLNKNEAETLTEGDYLGLLPNAYWFKIISNKETKIKTEAENSNTRIDQNNEENITTSNKLDKSSNSIDSPANKTVTINTEAACLPCHSEHNTSNSNQLATFASEVHSAGPLQEFGSAEFEKTRRLPLWMYEIDEGTDTSKSSNKRPEPNSWERKKKQKLSETDTTTGSGTELGTEKVNSGFPSTSKMEITNGLTNSTSDLQSAVQVQGETSKESEKKGCCERDENNKKDFAAKRPICQYEGNCYRKNPQHKSEYCHPGDLDYIPYEDRPFCQYGASCYRRNEKHRVEFRHPPHSSASHNSLSPCSSDSVASSPLPSKRRRKKVRTETSDCEDDDEDDLEDPFVNDASSDEYVPSDYEDEEE